MVERNNNMGYYMEQVGSNFTIKKANIQKAWDSLIELFKIEKKSILENGGYHYSWIDTKSVLDAETFKDAMDEAARIVAKEEEESKKRKIVDGFGGLLSKTKKCKRKRSFSYLSKQ